MRGSMCLSALTSTSILIGRRSRSMHQAIVEYCVRVQACLHACARLSVCPCVLISTSISVADPAACTRLSLSRNQRSTHAKHTYSSISLTWLPRNPRGTKNDFGGKTLQEHLLCLLRSSWDCLEHFLLFRSCCARQT